MWSTSHWQQHSRLALTSTTTLIRKIHWLWLLRWKCSLQSAEPTINHTHMVHHWLRHHSAANDYVSAFHSKSAKMLFISTCIVLPAICLRLFFIDLLLLRQSPLWTDYKWQFLKASELMKATYNSPNAYSSLAAACSSHTFLSGGIPKFKGLLWWRIKYLQHTEKLISTHQMNNYFILCMNLYFVFVTAQKPQTKISVKISYALWFLVELPRLPLGCYLQYLHFFLFCFTELSSENPIVPNGAHSVCFPVSYMRKGLLSICSN